jgi:hypothetical protein
MGKLQLPSMKPHGVHLTTTAIYQQNLTLTLKMARHLLFKKTLLLEPWSTMHPGRQAQAARLYAEI